MSGAVQGLIGSLAGVVKDAFWSSVSLLLPGNGTNGAQNNTFLDGSTNNFTITRNGNTTQGTFSPFTAAAPYDPATKGGSGYFDGTGDYLTAGSSTNLALGSGDFTVELWVYLTAYNASSSAVLDWRTAGGTPANIPALALSASGVPSFYFQVLTPVLTGSSAISLNTWSHLAVVRNGGGSNNVTMYLNGVSIGTATDTSNMGIETLGINSPQAANGQAGYFSNLRLVKGTAVYTTGFTPPTAPLTAITNTQLLLNFTNAGIIDNAMLNDLETVGNAQISTAQSKFGGSSMYFDGTGDYLVSRSDTSNYAFGSGDFTIEMWIRFDAVNAIQCFYDSRPASTQGNYPLVYLNSDATIRLFVDSADRITSSAVLANTWYHLAISRSGTSTKMFINGTQEGSTYTDSTSYLNSAGRPWIGISALNSTQGFAGYIDDLRITKGVARYTANFTPPAAAFPTS